MSMFTELKAIEEEINRAGYAESQITFSLWCESVPMNMSDQKPLKGILVKNKVIGADDNITLTKVDELAADMEAICREWYFEDEITSKLVNIAQSADGYYNVWADGSYAAYGYLWSTCRLLQKGNEFVILEFYICD